jgi:YafQ family addiction module toxin component
LLEYRNFFDHSAARPSRGIAAELQGNQQRNCSGIFLEQNTIKEVMMLLIENDTPLRPEWKDHALKGRWASYRECHVGGDFLLIYRVDDVIGRDGGIVFVRTGTHSELFEGMTVESRIRQRERVARPS